MLSRYFPENYGDSLTQCFPEFWHDRNHRSLAIFIHPYHSLILVTEYTYTFFFSINFYWVYDSYIVIFRKA